MTEVNYAILNKDLIAALSALVGPGDAFTDQEKKEHYGQDETEDLVFLPELILRPSSVAEVSAIAAFCHTHHIPLTTRGAGTGLSGGALPVKGGVLLSMERFNTILSIDERNLQATVEPGVIN